MYMKYLLAILTICTLNAAAQGEEEAVKQPIMQFFEGMRRSDSNMIKAAVAPGAILQTIVKNKEGKTGVHTENLARFITAVTTPHEQVYDERITFDLIRVDADLAIAWTPYQFYVGNTFSHCGVNSFQLVKLGGAWRIQYIIDTRRKNNCK